MTESCLSESGIPGSELPLLECRGLSKHFGGIVAVKDLTFSVSKGEIFGLIGPNGAGKTTVFNLITGFYRPTSGEIHFRGKSTTGLLPPNIVRLGVARTFQNIRLFENLSVLDNVRTVLYRKASYGLVPAIVRTFSVRRAENAISETAMGYLAEVGLEKSAHMLARSLPYGLQRKLEIARALALEPRLLLLDEPAAGMNLGESLDLARLIVDLKIRHHLTVILIEHHMDVVMSICPRILVMNFGQFLAVGTPEEVQSNPEVIKAYLGDEYRVS